MALYSLQLKIQLITPREHHNHNPQLNRGFQPLGLFKENGRIVDIATRLSGLDTSIYHTIGTNAANINTANANRAYKQGVSSFERGW